MRNRGEVENKRCLTGIVAFPVMADRVKNALVDGRSATIFGD